MARWCHERAAVQNLAEELRNGEDVLENDSTGAQRDDALQGLVEAARDVLASWDNTRGPE